MNNEYYSFLGLNEDATDEELKARYEELKKKYSEERWQDGEAGNEAARNLNKLDVAYSEIQTERRERNKVDDLQAYTVLGVAKTATDEQIKARYEELKKELQGEENAEKAAEIDKAYQEIQSVRSKDNPQNKEKSEFEVIAELLKSNKISEAQARLDNFNERGAEWHYMQAVVFYKKNWSNESKKQLEIAMQMDPNNKKYQDAYGKLNAKNEYARQAAQQDPYAGNNGTPVNDPSSQQMGGNACSNCISCCYTYLCVDCLFSLCCGCR